MLQKQLLLTAAMIAALGLTACGKDKTVGNPPPDQTKTTTPQSDGSMTSDLPQPGGDGSYSNAPAPTDTSVIGNQAGSTPVSPDYDSANSQSIDSNRYGKRVTGAVANDGLLYTSTATDDTLDVLRGLKRDNLGLAASVSWATLKFDSITGESIVTLKVQENGFTKVYNLVGSDASEDNQAVKLRSARSGNGQKTTGSLPISGSLRCLDLDGGCEVTLVKVQLGYAGSSNLVNIVFRQSVADLNFKLPEVTSGNPEYDIMEDMAISTYSKSNNSSRVHTSRMYSWEVANGRAGFSVVLRTYTNELLGFSGPLLSPESGNATNITLNRLNKDPMDDADGVVSDSVRLNLQNTIGEARLIANNGLGQLRVAFKMRKRGTYKQDVFTITFMRRLKPVVDLKDLSQSDESSSNGNNSGYGNGNDGGSDLPSVE